MEKSLGREWDKEVIAKRVTVSLNVQNLRVSIKAPPFALGNNFLTLCITIGVLTECAITYLIIKSNGNLAILVPGFLLLGAGLAIGFVKLWLWHNFGEELITIKGNSFKMQRNYGLFKSNVNHLVLNNESELYINRTDTWSWREFRGKGVFRLSTIDAKLADFGLKLGDAEYEIIIGPIAERLERLKKQANGIQFSQSEESSAPASLEKTQEVSPEVIKKEASINDEEIQPPSLEQQTEGQHLNALNEYLEKTTSGKVVKQSDHSKEDQKKESL